MLLHENRNRKVQKFVITELGRIEIILDKNFLFESFNMEFKNYKQFSAKDMFQATGTNLTIRTLPEVLTRSVKF